eukprot:10709463-Alexandrium_andersonii.AAC.1
MPPGTTRGQCLGARQGTQTAQPRPGCSLAIRRGRRPAGPQPEATPRPGLADGPPADGMRP